MFERMNERVLGVGERERCKERVCVRIVLFICQSYCPAAPRLVLPLELKIKDRMHSYYY
jgi:hypothetical protein